MMVDPTRIPALVGMLRAHDCEHAAALLALESAEEVVGVDAVVMLVDLLDSTRNTELILSILGNVAMDFPAAVVGSGIVGAIDRLTCRGVASYACACVLSILTRGLPHTMYGAVPALTRLAESCDEETSYPALWALTHFVSVGGENAPAALVRAGVGRALVNRAAGAPARLLLPILFCLANLAAGDDDATQHVVDAEPVGLIVGNFGVHNEAISRAIALLCSNISAGTPKQRLWMFDTGLVGYFIARLYLETSGAVVGEVLMILGSCTKPDSIQRLDELGAVAALVHLRTNGVAVPAASSVLTEIALWRASSG